MNSAPIQSARLDWPSAIGQFLLSFGTLDYLIVVYLKSNLEPSEFAKVKEWGFKDRMSRMGQHLGDSGTADRRDQFARIVARLDPTRELRNQIAHGHMLCKMNEESAAKAISLSLPKDLDQEYSPEARHVTFDELRASLGELTELIEELKALAGFRDSSL
jgi:hypothetical protein